MGIKCKLHFFFHKKNFKSEKQKMINLNEELFKINVNSVNNNNDDYCTIIQSNGGNSQSYQIYAHRCDDTSIRGYPLCRLIRMFTFLFFIY